MKFLRSCCAATCILTAVSASPIEERQAAPSSGPPLAKSFTSDSLSQSTNSATHATTTGNTNSSTTATGSDSATEVLRASATATEAAVFTANGGVYTASAYSGIVVVDGFKTLSAGGPNALIGGVAVTVTSDVIVQNGQSVTFEPVTESSTVVPASSNSASRSVFTSLSTTSSVAVPASSASGSGSDGTASAAASATSATGRSGAEAFCGKPKSSLAAVGAVAALMCLLA